jgi:hypothetical protein
MLREVALAENVSAHGVRVLLEREWRPGQRVLVGSLQHNLIIFLVAAILCLPCLLVGIPEGNDSTTHAMYQYHFSHQFWSGDLYPRWLADANKGYGSPIFLIQYPLPYFITALLRPITSFPPTATRESRELGVYCFLVLAAAGFAARAWFRNRCTPVASTVAAVAYILLPYILGQGLYFRMGLGELSAFVWMPLALALCDSIQWGFVAVSVLGVVFALLLLSQVLTAALFVPLMIGYTIVCARSANLSITRSVVTVLLALAMGIGIAAVYVFPLVAYQKLIDLSAMQANMPSFELGRGFAFVTSSYLPRRWVAVAMAGAVCLVLVTLRYIWSAGGSFVHRACMVVTLGLGIVMIIPDFGPKLVRLSGLRVSPVDVPHLSNYFLRIFVTGLLTVALGLLAYCRISRTGSREREQLLLIVACGSFMLMLPWSAPLWKAIPQLAVLQFPSRLCTILTIAVAGLFAVAMDNCLCHRNSSEGKPSLVVISLAAFTVIAAGGLTWGVTKQILRPATVRVDLTQEVDLMFRAYVSREHLAVFAKMLGTAPDSFDVASTPVEDVVRAEFTDGRGVVNLVRVGPGKLRVSAQCYEDARVRITQLYSPLWRVVQRIPSPDRPVLDSSRDGLIQVSLGVGQHDFELVFDGGWPERWGLIVTLASILVAVGGSAFGGLWGRVRKPNVNEQHAASWTMNDGEPERV